MRILHVIPTLVVGGAERMVARLAGHLHRWGHTVSVAVMYDPLHTWIEAELISAGIPLQFLGKQPGLDLAMIPRLARVIAGFRPDVLHTHMYVLKYCLPAMIGGRCRTVHTLHSVAEEEVELASRLLQQVAFRAGVVPVAIGEGVAESMRSTYRLDPRHVIPNGIPVSDCAPPPGAREQVRSSLGIPADSPTFACIAQFVPAKNHEGLISAFASQRLRSRNAHLLLAGDGDRRPQLERQAREAGAADHIHFLGVRSDVPAVLAAADAFVLASRREGNPLSVMEAMAAGKPVLATAVGCIPELVPEGAGRLVRPGEPGSLEAAMFEIAGDLGLARMMGGVAARFARERFDDADMARAYERLYNAVI